MTFTPTEPPQPASWGSDLPQRLAAALAGPLPGARAYRRWAPELAFGRHQGPPPADARPAATLLVLYADHGEWHIPLTVRNARLAHGGQVSLPGGSLEAGETPEQAATREMEEELGLAARDVHVLGRLTPLWVFVSNFWVTPCVAYCPCPPAFSPQAAEVERHFALPLQAILNPAHHGSHWVERRGLRFAAPHLAWQGTQIWGATALMLGELAMVLEDL